MPGAWTAVSLKLGPCDERDAEGPGPPWLFVSWGRLMVFSSMARAVSSHTKKLQDQHFQYRFPVVSFPGPTVLNLGSLPLVQLPISQC